MSDQEVLEQEEDIGEHDDLGVHPEHAEAETEELEKLNDRSPDTGDPDGDLYHPEADGKPSGFRNKVKARIKTKRARRGLAVGGALGGCLVVLLALLAFFVGSLLIPNFANHIATYQFARVAREYADTNNNVLGEKILVDGAEGDAASGAFGALKDKYQGLREDTWGKFDKYRPKKVVDNLEKTKADTKLNRLDYVYEDRQCVGGFCRQKLTKIIIDGEEIPVGSRGLLDKYLNPIDSVKSKIELRSKLSASLQDSLEGTNSLVRSRVAKEVRGRIDSKLFRWRRSAPKGDPANPDSFEGLTEEEAAAKNAKLNEKIATDSGKAYDAAAADETVDTLKQAEKDAADLAKNCDEACTAKTLAEGSTTPSAAAGAIEGALKSGALEKTVSTLSSVYAVALPVCLIYDGSIVKSQGSIDANSSELERLFYTVMSASDQQKGGNDVTASSIGALGKQLGPVGASDSEAQANGRQIDTSGTMSPQASAGGSKSIVSALFPPALAKPVDSITTHVCPGLTNIWVGLGLGTAELALKIGIALIPGAGEAADASFQAGEVAVEQTVTTIIKKELFSFAKETFTKDAAKSFVKVGAAIGAATFLARFIVVNRIATTHNGLAQGLPASTEINMGGNLAAQEQDRSMMMGAPMTKPARVKVGLLDKQYLAQQSGSKSTFDRYLALTNPDSLLTKFGMATLTTLHFSAIGSVVQFGTRALNPSSWLTRSVLGMNHSVAFAQETNTDQDYGIVQWGWTADETALINSDPSYQHLLENQRILDESGKGDEVADKFSKCFDQANTMGKVLQEQWIVRNKAGEVDPDQGDCAPNKLGPRNSEYGDLVFRWRLSKRYANVIEHLSGIQDPQTSDTNTASSSGDATNANVYVLGDSLTAGMKQAGLEAALKVSGWSATVNGVPSRPLFYPNGQATDSNGRVITDGFSALDQDQSAIKSAGSVVIGLGTNKQGGGEAEYQQKVGEIVDKVRALSPNAKIYWTNLVGTGSKNTYAPYNQILQTLSAPNSKNFTIIDWAAVGAQYIPANDVHPGPAGYQKLIDTVVGKLGTAPSAASAGTGAPGVSTLINVAALTRPSDTIACAAGSEELKGPGANNSFDGYTNGTKIAIKLCAINDLPVVQLDGDSAESIPGSQYYIAGANSRAVVNSVVSENVVSMAQSAKAQGVDIKALSSFRTNAHQTAACGGTTGSGATAKCRNGGYAPPGYSGHQLGEAIDFVDSNRNRTANCKGAHLDASGRCIAPGDPIWEWLDKNAGQFGFKQLKNESWHWSPTAN